MKTRDHLKLARHLAAQNNSDKVLFYHCAFVLGSISPDINFFTHISGRTMAGHTYEESYSSIKKKLEKILEKDEWTVKDAYTFGTVVHYMTDYFTYAHNTGFKGNLREHNNYEKELRKMFSKYLEYNSIDSRKRSCYQINRKQMLHYIELKHKEYKECRVSMEDDCLYILKICDSLMRLYFLNGKKRTYGRKVPRLDY